VHLPDALHLRTDARLVGELVAGLLDHAIRATRGEIEVWLDDAGTLTVRVDRRWLDGDAIATLSVATADPPFDRTTLGLFVAGAVARMLGTTVQVEGDRGVTVSLPASVATLPN
jgi:signal transduction histidine kinase